MTCVSGSPAAAPARFAPRGRFASMSNQRQRQADSIRQRAGLLYGVGPGLVTVDTGERRPVREGSPVRYRCPDLLVPMRGNPRSVPDR
jgi:hypothetical protein